MMAPMTEIYENRIAKDYEQLAKVICNLQEKLDNADNVLLVRN